MLDHKCEKTGCPHCNTPLDNLCVKRCHTCNGIIWYISNLPRKGYFVIPDLPIVIKDILAIVGLIAVAGYVYFYIL